VAGDDVLIIPDHEVREPLQDRHDVKTYLFVAYSLFTEDGEMCDRQWLCSRKKGAGRKWYLRETFLDAAHDFRESHGDKSVTYANAFSKIVKVGKAKLEDDYEVELVYVRENYKRTVTVVSEQNPMALIALASL